MRLIKEADISAYRDFGNPDTEMNYSYDDYNSRSREKDINSTSNRSKSQFTKTSHKGTKLKSISTQKKPIEKPINTSKIKQEEQLQEVLALYDKHFLEYKTNEVKLGKSSKVYKKVDFSKLDNLDFETNKQRVEDFMAEIREEEAIHEEEQPKIPTKLLAHDDVELI